MLEFNDEKQRLQVEELRQREEEEFVRMAAKNRDLQYLSLYQTSVDMDALRLISEEEAKSSGAVAFKVHDKNVSVAITNPDNDKLPAILEKLKAANYRPQVFLVTSRSFNWVLEKYGDLSLASEAKAGSFDISNEEITEILNSVKTVADVKKLVSENLEGKQTYRTTRIIEILLAGALSVGASDIHMEPEQEYVRLRYRFDGVLNDILQFDHTAYKYVLSRIKLLSGLKLNIGTEAQDGRFSINAKKSDIEVRTSILPGGYGESIVMRILDPESISVSMESLGFEKHLKEILEKEITRPNGMILTTGPTGSGKTTTLYAFLKKVHDPGVKIITIEDPIEYHLPGVVQTQTNPEQGYTFSSGLRAGLRQDPDIMMVGEIRDNETAEIAVNAALTGHLVFSTLHTNNAAGTFPRLLELGVNPKIITSAINVSIAQRLARKLCESCKKETALAGKDLALVEKTLASMPHAEYKNLPHKMVFTSVGCDKCNGTGYKGRIGLYEAIMSDESIEKVMLSNPSEREIAAVAKNQGILTIAQDGIVKVLQGITSLSELRRVADVEEG